jgi:hypothetical protein
MELLTVLPYVRGSNGDIRDVSGITLTVRVRSKFPAFPLCLTETAPTVVETPVVLSGITLCTAIERRELEPVRNA